MASSNFRKKIIFTDLGLIPFRDAYRLQKKMRDERVSDKAGDTILMCEHPPVFTLGKQDCAGDWLSTPEGVRTDGIDIVQCDRGGRITYHGPGQLVVYFILRIQDYSSGVKDFVSMVEDICIALLGGFDLPASRNGKYPGVWIDNRKIAAIGLNISHGVSMHGLALNVCPNMAHYAHIIPCGIRDFGVTSLALELGVNSPSMKEVKMALIKSTQKIWFFRD